ncbi:hypothetical protein M9H77_21824 [Catharanthus roseus]|uniref:Uncharacterized protein n=1 Tax=Catharanthus roseus TaxID=4058 RepID=A0ACC0AP51_CATRO|nr:hypothetical protein M9H77_21824 [Catharanthus roseus]
MIPLPWLNLHNFPFMYGIEVVLGFNGVKDLKGFQDQAACSKMTTRIGKTLISLSLNETQRKGSLTLVKKAIQCRECEEYCHIQAEYANTLKKNRSVNTTLSNDDKKSDSQDGGEDTDSNEKLAFNVIIDLEDISMHIDHNNDSDDDSIYTNEEVFYEELQDRYNLLYTKWVGLVKLYQELKDSLKKVQEQKDALEERNYELIAQVKNATERVSVAEGKIEKLNTGKAKLDEIVSVGRRARMKTGLGNTGANLNHITGMYVTQHESSYTTFGKLK